MYAFRLKTSGRYLISQRHYTVNIQLAHLFNFWNYDVALGYKTCLEDMGIEVDILFLGKDRKILKVNNKKIKP